MRIVYLELKTGSKRFKDWYVSIFHKIVSSCIIIYRGSMSVQTIIISYAIKIYYLIKTNIKMSVKP